ncbi:hypothetical protein L1887_36140 [Cichorium endivia]|nr:hypothetical protein L1887_36140 [Cichorium endivia]
MKKMGSSFNTHLSVMGSSSTKHCYASPLPCRSRSSLLLNLLLSRLSRLQFPPVNLASTIRISEKKPTPIQDLSSLDLKTSLEMTEALRLPVEVQSLHEQLTIQRNLHMRIEEKGKYLQMIFEIQCKFGIEHLKASSSFTLEKSEAKLTNEISSSPVLTEADPVKIGSPCQVLLFTHTPPPPLTTGSIAITTLCSFLSSILLSLSPSMLLEQSFSCGFDLEKGMDNMKRNQIGTSDYHV